MNDLAAAKSSTANHVERALELLAERMGVLAAVDGKESRLMGFLHFKVQDLFCGADLKKIVMVLDFCQISKII